MFKLSPLTGGLFAKVILVASDILLITPDLGGISVNSLDLFKNQ